MIFVLIAAVAIVSGFIMPHVGMVAVPLVLAGATLALMGPIFANADAVFSGVIGKQSSGKGTGFAVLASLGLGLFGFVFAVVGRLLRSKLRGN